MNLLFLTPQLPYPPRQGTAIRNWGLLSQLARRHRITLLSFVEPGQPPDAPELHRVCQEVIAVEVQRRTWAKRVQTLFSARPDLATRLWSPEFDHALARLLERYRFDVVQIEGLEMAPYVDVLLAMRNGRPGPKIIYDAHNAEHVIQQRALVADRANPARWPAALYSWAQAARLRRYEAAVCRSVDAVTCVSAEDAAALRRLVPSLAPVVVPNGLDLGTYAGARKAAAEHAGEPMLVFTGKMDYRPNVDAASWFAREILPLVRAARPGVRLVIVGQKPSADVTRLGRGDGIVVTGEVEETRPYIAGAAVYVAPLRMGGGTRFKLLEAMAMGRPVVSTTIGAEGFAVRSGRELILADTAGAFAEAVLDLLANPARAARLGEAGRAFVRAHHDWDAIVPRLEGVY